MEVPALLAVEGKVEHAIEPAQPAELAGLPPATAVSISSDNGMLGSVGRTTCIVSDVSATTRVSMSGAGRSRVRR